MRRNNSITIEADGSNRGHRAYMVQPFDEVSTGRRSASSSVVGDGSNRGHRASHVQTYDEAMQQEYALELHSLEAGQPRVIPVPIPPMGQTELDKSGAKIQIETVEPQGWASLAACLDAFPQKLKGGLDKRLPVPPPRELIWSFIGAFLGIMSVAVLNQWLSPEIDLPLLVGSFGASAVLIFAVPDSKLSQPRNFLGGQVISALVGIVVRLIIHKTWISEPVGMSLALAAMQLTSTTHPPGGATALIVCSMQELPKWSGFSFLLTVMFGSVVMQIVALVVNGVNPGRQYPTFWY